MRLHKNKILITGATGGIGKTLTQKFLSLDNLIIAVGRSQKRLEKLAASDNRIIPFQCDISKQEELDALSLFIENEHGDLNILINNAGIQYNYSFLDGHQMLYKVEHEMNVNFLAPLKLIVLLLPILQANDNAAIVNVSSGLAIVPKAQAPVYCGTKAGIHIFSKALRYQMDTVKVFEILPPIVDTKMTMGKGNGKISPQRLADEFIRAFRNDRYEVNIHKVKLLRIINRISPKIADRIMKGVTP